VKPSLPRPTYGDESALACPWCRRKHQFSDWLFDGWEGGTHECEDCKRPFEVEVEYLVQLTASAKEPAAK
jgi:hypothetical protein